MRPIFSLTVAMATVTANQNPVGSNSKSKQDIKKKKKGGGGLMVW